MEALIKRGDLHIFRFGFDSGARKNSGSGISSYPVWQNGPIMWSKKSDVEADQEYNFEDNRGIW